jgi:ribbon-helix-helix CopG family protein
VASPTVKTRTPALYGRKLAACHLDPQVIDALDIIARRNGRSRSEELRRAVAAWILLQSQFPPPIRP